jgi:hypothetical protein
MCARIPMLSCAPLHERTQGDPGVAGAEPGHQRADGARVHRAGEHGVMGRGGTALTSIMIGAIRVGARELNCTRA